MSHGNLTTLLQISKSEKLNNVIKELLKLDEKILNKMETLFPIPLKDYTQIDKSYEAEYIAILMGTINRYNGSKCREFKFENYPSRLEFYAVIGVESDNETKPFVVSYKEFLEYILNGEKVELDIKAINPNLNRLGKMIYGESIKNVVGEMNEWFVGHLIDDHTHLFKKNIGEDYNKDKLQDRELEASEDWLDIEFQSEIKNAFQLYQNCRYPMNAKYDSTINCVDLFRMMQVIEIVESDKSGIQGYGFTSEEELNIEQPIESSIGYLINKFSTEESKLMLTKLSEYTNISDLAYTILEVAKDNCITYNISLLLKGVLTEIYYNAYKDPVEDNVPTYKIASTLISRNASLEQLINTYKEAKDKWEVIEVDRKGIWDYLPDCLINKDIIVTAKGSGDNIFLLYDNRNKSMTPYGKALCLKYKLDMHKVYEYKQSLKDVKCSEELKGEASAIIVAQLNGFKIPNHERVPRDYYNYFIKNHKSIQEILNGN